jgi:type VI secretion system secreted protein VgrG
MNNIKTSLNLPIVHCSIKEGLSEPFFCTLHVLSQSPLDILEKDVEVVFFGRVFYGFVIKVSQLSIEDEQSLFEVILSHVFYKLNHQKNYRIFHKKTTLTILQSLYGSFLPAFQKNKIHDYMTQYDETDFNFISRLLECEGIFYTLDGKKLILHDNSESFPVIYSYFMAEKGTPKEEMNVIKNMFQTSCHAQTYEGGANYTCALPQTKLRDKVVSQYPGPFESFDEMIDYKKQKHEERDWQKEVFCATSTIPDFSPGFGFRIKNHPHFHDAYLIQTVEHFLSKDGYENRFVAFLHKKRFRTPQNTPKPKMHGYHSARVIGPSHDEVHTNHLGEIKVQFPFEDKFSCWVRVMQPLAGSGFGSVFVPRIGMEVVVMFLDADPNRPIVVGCLYHALNKPPIDPSENPLQVRLETRAKNSISFEDKKGEEGLKILSEQGEIFIESHKSIVLKSHKDITLNAKETIHLCAQHLTVKTDMFSAQTHVFELDSTDSITIKSNKNISVIAMLDTLIQAGNNAIHKGLNTANHEGEMLTLIKGVPAK